MRRHDLPHVGDRRQYAGERQRASVNDLFAIDEHLEFAVVTVFELDVCAKRLAQISRHPGGLNIGDSIPAAANCDRHFGFISPEEEKAKQCGRVSSHDY